MAALRAQSWGSMPYWHERISGYLTGAANPKEALAPRTAIVAVDGDRVVGFIAGHLTKRYGCDGELEWIEVHEGVRRSGIATELLRRLAQWFVEHDAQSVCVDVDPENLGARSFYSRNGATTLKPSWLVWQDIGTLAR